MAFFKKVVIFATFFALSGCFDHPRLYKKTRLLMGTFVEVTAASPEVINFAFSFMEKLSKRLNGYYPDSDIYRLNKNAGCKAVKVSPQTIEILILSRKMYELTEGVFDVSAGRIIKFWKQMMRKEKLKKLPPLSEIKKIASYKGIKEIRIDAQNLEVFIKNENIRLDLGGIAKGYIVDKTIEALKKKGVKSILINAGGDIYALGNNPQKEKPWKVGIRNPQNPRQIVNVVALSDAAIATSGDSEQFFTCCGKIYSHIIDLKSGLPVEKRKFVSVSVIAPNLTTADGLATTLFILGRDKIPVFLAQRRSNFRVFVVEGEKDNVHIYQFGEGF